MADVTETKSYLAYPWPKVNDDSEELFGNNGVLRFI